MSVQYEDFDGIVQTMKTRAKTSPINFHGDDCPKMACGGGKSVYPDEDCLGVFESAESVIEHVGGFVEQVLVTERISNQKRYEIKTRVLEGTKRIMDIILTEKNIVKLNNTIQSKVLDLLAG